MDDRGETTQVVLTEETREKIRELAELWQVSEKEVVARCVRRLYWKMVIEARIDAEIEAKEESEKGGEKEK